MDGATYAGTLFIAIMAILLISSQLNKRFGKYTSTIIVTVGVLVWGFFKVFT